MTTNVHIFIVEDHAPIQNLLDQALTRSGFSVAHASTAEDAIRMLEKNQNEARKYGVLVTDIDLGQSKKSGWDVAKRAREINGEIPVIYMSGASAHDWASNGVPNSVILLKPFAPTKLVTAVSQLLSVSNTTGA